jgi:hypothetical protein
MLSESDLEAVVHRAIALYNRLRSPEINIKLVFFSPAMLTVSFTGGFCYGCGVLDYVEGFAKEFKILSSKAELKVRKTRQINARTFEADYIIKTKDS